MKIVRDLTEERWLVWRGTKWLWSYSQDRASTFEDENRAREKLAELGITGAVSIDEQPEICDTQLPPTG